MYEVTINQPNTKPKVSMWDTTKGQKIKKNKGCS